MEPQDGIIPVPTSWALGLLAGPILCIYIYQHLQRGAKWFLRGVNSLGFNWHPLEGASVYVFFFSSLLVKKNGCAQRNIRKTKNVLIANQRHWNMTTYLNNLCYIQHSSSSYPVSKNKQLRIGKVLKLSHTLIFLPFLPCLYFSATCWVVTLVTVLCFFCCLVHKVLLDSELPCVSSPQIMHRETSTSDKAFAHHVWRQPRVVQQSRM